MDVKLIQLIVSGEDDRGLYGQLRDLIGSNVNVRGAVAFGAGSRRRHALVSMVVSSVSSNRTDELRNGPVADRSGMEPSDRADEQAITIQPSNPPDEPGTGVESQGTGMDAVAGFYLALGAGNGTVAAQHVIPAKRRSGPLSAKAMSSFYGDLKRPLRLLNVTDVGGGRYRASYTFETRQGSRCDGTSVVTTVRVHGTNLISKIVAEDGC